ncbi:MAG: T9SS type A sorting domain-containing protein [Bacteroidia bacterium]
MDSLRRLIVYNAMGQPVYESNSTQKNSEINLDAAPAGIYFVKFEGNYIKLIKEN